MRTVTQTTTTRKFETLEEMAEWQAHLDYANDMHRHTPPAPATTHYADATGRVLLGQRDLADAQRAIENAAGGLVAYMMSR